MGTRGSESAVRTSGGTAPSDTAHGGGLAVAGRAFLALTLLGTGIAKLISPASTAWVPILPDCVQPYIPHVASWLEITIGVGLLIPRFSSPSTVGAQLLLSGFAAYHVLQPSLSGPRSSCGCLGKYGPLWKVSVPMLLMAMLALSLVAGPGPKEGAGNAQ